MSFEHFGIVRSQLGHRQFLEFCSLVFLKIAYDNNLEQCITSVSGKTHEKHWWSQNSAKQAKIGPKLDFHHFPKCGSLVFF